MNDSKSTLPSTEMINYINIWLITNFTPYIKILYIQFIQLHKCLLAVIFIHILNNNFNSIDYESWQFKNSFMRTKQRLPSCSPSWKRIEQNVGPEHSNGKPALGEKSMSRFHIDNITLSTFLHYEDESRSSVRFTIGTTSPNRENKVFDDEDFWVWMRWQLLWLSPREWNWFGVHVWSRWCRAVID